MTTTVLFPTEAAINPLAFYQKEILHAPLLVADRKGYAQRIMCPFCIEADLSFVIRAKTGAYRCMSCEKSGASVLDFIMAYKKLSRDQAQEYLIEQYGIAPAVAPVAEAPSAPDAGPAPHPLCRLLPDMSPKDFASLKEDIQAHGLRHPILLHEDLILDGRHRARACAELGVYVRFEQWTGDDPLAYVLSENLHRRHLTISQKAMVAAAAMDLHRPAAQARQMAGTTLAQDCANPTEGGKAAAAAAASVGVSTRSVESADKVRREGTPEDVRAVMSGEATVNSKLKEIKQRQESGGADPTGPASAPVAETPLPYRADYLTMHQRDAAHLAKLARDLKAAMGSEQRTGVPIAEALALLRDIKATTEKLASSLSKRLSDAAQEGRT